MIARGDARLATAARGARYRPLLLGCLLSGLGAAPLPAAPMPESLFVAGRFDEADSGFAARLATQPADTSGLLRRGQIALLRNRTEEARTWFDRASRAGATWSKIPALVGESFYRDRRFEEAASAFETAGRSALARKLRALGRDAYEIRGPDRVALPFVQTDPLPLVELRVNGRGPLFFILDTGGGELILDSDLADTLGAKRYGEESASYAADQRRAFQHGSVDSVALGELTVLRVPVHLIETRRFSAAAGGRRVAGILGTTLLSRFRFTIDYPGRALVLERRSGNFLPDRDTTAVEVPLWWGGHHFLLARGSYRSSGPLTWFIDTGLAGGAFTAPATTLLEAGVVLRDTTGFTGQGGGGAVRVVPFRVDSLRLGPIEESELMGMLGPFPASLEYSLGTRVAGILSHAFFRPYRVTFDLDRMRLRLTRPR